MVTCHRASNPGPRLVIRTGKAGHRAENRLRADRARVTGPDAHREAATVLPPALTGRASLPATDRPTASVRATATHLLQAMRGLRV